MKLIIKVILIAGIAAVTAPYFIKGPDGTPLLSLPDFANRDFSLNSVQEKLDIKDLSSPMQSNDSHSDDIGIYRWKDENGQWHMSDRPPAGQFETLKVNGDQNLMKALAKQTDQTEQSSDAGEKKKAEAVDESEESSVPVGLTTVSPDQIPKLIEDAKKLQKMLSERKLNQDAAIDGN